MTTPPPDAGDWSRVTDLFHRAMAEPPDRRDAFLDRACGGDAALRAEVVSLLSAHDRAGGFLEQPAAQAADLLDRADADAPLVGRQIGQYRVLRILGTGGMGVVYLADDTRLGRPVALKALPAELADDEVRRDRLRREARAAAALSHPGIATVYALEEFDDHLFLATEYVPGETLRDEIGRGAQPPTRALDTAIGLARALAAAHGRGTVHRDLKPENVMRTPDGGVKILDFGLARFRDPGGQSHPTRDGTRLGTPAYMSPEQIRGEPADFRADQFALGLVIHELATGRHPFGRIDAAATMAAILESETPSLAEAAAVGLAPREKAVLAGLEAVLATCLEKDPAARFRSTGELVVALEAIRTTSIEPRATPSGRPSRPTGPVRHASAYWWWRFHEIVASVGYVALLVPLWFVREWTSGPIALAVVLIGIAAVVIGVALRLHQVFVRHAMPGEWPGYGARAALWVRLADWGLVVSLGGSALLTATAHPHLTILLVGAAVAVLVSFAVIEPVTSKAAGIGS